MGEKVTRAMIFAAGLGTRFKPWTDAHPKALAPVNGKSLLQRNIEYLQGFGIREVVVNVHHFADQILDVLKKNNGWGSEVFVSDETDVVLETGGGLVKARQWLEGGGPFVAMNVDILTDMDLGAMMGEHFVHRPLATVAVSSRTTSRYFLFDAGMRLRGWRNVQTGAERMAGVVEEGLALKEMAFSGIHLIDPAIFPVMQQSGKFSMVDVYLGLGGDHVIKGYDHTGAKLIDVGKPEAAEKAAWLFID